MGVSELSYVAEGRSRVITWFTRRLILTFLLSASLSSFAQLLEDESADLAESSVEPQIEEVYVTGSLLPKGDFVSKAPIATISSSQFEMSNAVNVENLINSMPQVVGGADRSSSFGQGIALSLIHI